MNKLGLVLTIPANIIGVLLGVLLMATCSSNQVTIDPADCDHIRTFTRDGRRMNLYLCAVETTVQEKFKQH